MVNQFPLINVRRIAKVCCLVSNYYSSSWLIYFVCRLDNCRTTMESVGQLIINDDDNASCVVDSVINPLEQNQKSLNGLLGSEFDNGKHIYL